MGNAIDFQIAASTVEFGVNSNSREMTIVSINGNIGYLFAETAPKLRSSLIWSSKETGVAFMLMADVDSDELIAIAESVRIVE